MLSVTPPSFLIFFIQAVALIMGEAIPPPLPVLPLPTHAQMKWQQREMILFFHFSVNTFTDSEWGTGHESPTIFNPTNLNTTQWIQVAAETGFSLAILTAKHHDGFCLWPSDYTPHSVKGSPWRGSKGDVIDEFAKSAKARGIDIGLYLSPWDRHEESYGKEIAYNEFYLGQLRELITRYGDVQEVWFDGAKGANATNMTYYFSSWFAMARELQASVNIFSDAGPDVRWVGNEEGYAGETSWSRINRTELRIGEESIVEYLNAGDPAGTDWIPAECDVSIRKGWFWHASQKPKSLRRLLDVYYKSVGRNCVLLLNVPPNSTGIVPEEDVKRLREFRSAIDLIFGVDRAAGSIAHASSERGGSGAKMVIDEDHMWSYWAPDSTDEKPWIELGSSNLEGYRFNVVRIQEAIGLGQRIRSHRVLIDGVVVAEGTTVGYKRLHRLTRVIKRGTRLKLEILESQGMPLISSLGLHYDPFLNLNSNYHVIGLDS